VVDVKDGIFAVTEEDKLCGRAARDLAAEFAAN